MERSSIWRGLRHPRPEESSRRLLFDYWNKENMMKVKLLRAALLLFTVAGLAAVTGSQAFKVQAKTPTCTVAILRGGYGAGSTGLLNTSSNPNDIRLKTFAPFAEA